MIEHPQASGSSGINFNSITYDLDSILGSVIVSGLAELSGRTVIVSGTLELARLTAFISVDGLVSSSGGELLCWYDGTELNIIRHN